MIEPTYDLNRPGHEHPPVRPIRDSMPVFYAERGGITFPRPDEQWTSPPRPSRYRVLARRLWNWLPVHKAADHSNCGTREWYD